MQFSFIFSVNLILGVNDFIKVSLFIKCFVLVCNVSDPCFEWFWGKNSINTLNSKIFCNLTYPNKCLYYIIPRF